tara:strand:- start:8 stop:187 length:180 start_codon:yes stop_codon:yes gene_type:complete
MAIKYQIARLCDIYSVDTLNARKNINNKINQIVIKRNHAGNEADLAIKTEAVATIKERL